MENLRNKIFFVIFMVVFLNGCDKPTVSVESSDKKEIKQENNILQKDLNYLIGNCEMPKKFEVCSKNELINKGGGAYWLFNEDKFITYMFAPLPDPNDPTKNFERLTQQKIEYLKGEKPDQIIVKKYGLDEDEKCIFYSRYSKENEQVFVEYLALNGECSEMAKEGNNEFKQKGKIPTKLLKYQE